MISGLLAERGPEDVDGYPGVQVLGAGLLE